MYNPEKTLFVVDTSVLGHMCYNRVQKEHIVSLYPTILKSARDLWISGQRPTEEELNIWLKTTCRMLSVQGREMLMREHETFTPELLATRMVGLSKKYPADPPRAKLVAFSKHVIQFFKSMALFPWDVGQVLFVGDGKPYWRKTAYEDYKSKRDTSPDKRYFLKSFVADVAPLMLSGYEADDSAAAVSQLATGKVVLLTIDTDWMQLVTMDDRVQWFRLMGGGFNEERLKGKRGVNDWLRKKIKACSATVQAEFSNRALTPHMVVDFKVRTGDISDNIPAIGKATRLGIDTRSIIDLVNPPAEHNLTKNKIFLNIWKSYAHDFDTKAPTSYDVIQFYPGRID